MVSGCEESRGTGNLFLDSLSTESRDHMSQYLVAVKLVVEEIVYEGGAEIKRVLFPTGSVVSIVTEMLDGGMVEVGFIGREGMTGLPIALGSGRVAQRALVQIPNSSLSMSVPDFQAVIRHRPDVLQHSLRYAQATISAVSQFAACNRLHPVIERLARWLLMAHDRVSSERITLTHEFLGQMLGVRRSGVTVAALTLQRAGFIEYSQGRIFVRNRAGLESASCECYLAVDRGFEDIMGYSSRRPMPVSVHS